MRLVIIQRDDGGECKDWCDTFGIGNSRNGFLSLSLRQKWFKMKKDVKPGDVVLVVSPDIVKDPLGRILEVYHGKLRTVKVQVDDKQYLRPIVKVCPLEFD